MTAGQRAMAYKRAHPDKRNAARRRRAERIRARLRDMLGGSCVKCGSTEGLHFDHIDPETKSFNVSARVRDVPFARLIEEAKKCQLLCDPCHRAKSRDEYHRARWKSLRLPLEAGERRHARRHGGEVSAAL